MPQLDVIIKGGKVQVSVIGATGQSCLGLAANLEAALGGVRERELKPEFYETETADVAMPAETEATR